MTAPSCEQSAWALLGLTGESAPDPAVAQHVAGCAACRDALRQAVEVRAWLEARSPEVPDGLVARALARLGRPPTAADPTPEIAGPGARMRRLAVGLALAVVLLAVGAHVVERVRGPAPIESARLPWAGWQAMGDGTSAVDQAVSWGGGLDDGSGMVPSAGDADVPLDPAVLIHTSPVPSLGSPPGAMVDLYEVLERSVTTDLERVRRDVDELGRQIDREVRG